MATMATVTLEDFETLPPCMTALESQTDGQPLRLAATSCGEPVTVATPPLPPEASAQAAKVLPETFSVAALRASSHCTMPVGGATGAGGGLGLGGGGLGGGGLGGGIGGLGGRGGGLGDGGGGGGSGGEGGGVHATPVCTPLCVQSGGL